MDRLRIAIESIRIVLEDPSANLEVSRLLLGMMIVVMLIVVLAFALWLLPARRRVLRTTEGTDVGAGLAPDEDFEGAEELGPDSGTPGGRADSTPRSRVVAVLVSGWFIGALVVAALGAGYVMTGTDLYCVGTCHGASPHVKAAVAAAHASCRACHERPGIAGIAGNVASRASMLVARVRGREPGQALVSASGCYSCHKAGLANVSESSSGIRISHAEPLAGGMTCRRCHGDVGHSAELRRVPMSACMPCHDGVKAPSSCETCHLDDPLSRPVVLSRDATGGASVATLTYPVARFENVSCALCHAAACSARCHAPK